MYRAQIMNLFLEETEHPGPPVLPNGAGASTSPVVPDDPMRLEIPEGLSYVIVDKDNRPILHQDLPPATDEYFLLEQIMWERVPRLLLMNMNMRSAAPLVNGNLAPPVVLLTEGDEVLFGPGGGMVGHVSIFRNVVIGPPPEKIVGELCPICLKPLAASSRVYVCQTCQSGYHFESKELTGGEQLTCARAGLKCSVCNSAFKFNDGFTYMPEFIRGH
jgi:hypothetical protein